MFNLFKKSSEVTTPEFLPKRRKEQPSVRPQKFTVQDIHNDFNSVADQIILEAEKIVNKPSLSDDALKANRLIALGFTQSESARKSSKEIAKAGMLIENSEKIKLQAEAVRYFSQKYPFNKFITLEKVNQLCEKYGLELAWVDRYIGDVPEKNLHEIENFKLCPEDAVVTITRYLGNGHSHNYYISLAESSKLKFKKPDEYGKEYLKNPKFGAGEHIENYSYFNRHMIIAPPSHILKYNEVIVDDKKVELKDPILIQPVLYEGLTEDRIFLIVTAWGQEASDPMVVNERMN